jgi:hypothetical protein
MNQSDFVRCYFQLNCSGAHVVGINCHFDADKQGFIDLPEFPFGLEPRICTRY